MKLKKLKTYLIAANIGVVALALPLSWGSGWLQANVFQGISSAGELSEAAPVRIIHSDSALDLQIYDNFNTGQNAHRFQQTVIDRINSARQEIIVCMYSFDIPEIKSALLQAKQRGVRIRLFASAANGIDLTNFWADAQNEIPLILVGSNIQSTNYSMHHKFMLVDPDTENRSLLTGSWNWTNLQEDLDPNLLMETHNREIIDSFRQEAERIAGGRNGHYKFGLDDFRPWSDLIKFSDGTVEIWYSPGRDRFSIQDRLLDMIDSAKSEIDIANTVIDSTFVADSLLKKAREGVKINIIFERLSANTDKSIFGYLQKHKGPHQLENLQLVLGGKENANDLGQFSIFHHHFMVVDGRRVLVGTGNWTYGGFFLNDENYLVIDSPAVAQVFSENFNYFLEKYRG